MPAKRSNSKDVAALAGVNQSTVSRAFAERGGVGEATRARVLKAAAKLNYTPDALARGLIRQRTNIIGIVMAGITSPFQSHVLERLVSRLYASGWQALVFNAAQGAEVEEVLPLALQYRVAALLITSAPLWSKKIEDVVQRLPVILFNRSMAGSRAASVVCDNHAGGRTIAEHLISLGHKRFGYIAGGANTSTNREREDGFVQRLAEAGLSCARAEGAYSYEAGQHGARQLLAATRRPSAIFCASDIIAMGAMDAARADGLHVPEEIAFAGFDDIPMASWGSYALTTIREPVDSMIEASVDLINQSAITPGKQGKTLVFPGALVVRQSTSPP